MNELLSGLGYPEDEVIEAMLERKDNNRHNHQVDGINHVHQVEHAFHLGRAYGYNLLDLPDGMVTNPF